MNFKIKMKIENFKILEKSSIEKALQKLEQSSMKALMVVNKQNKLLGILNDANIRRALLVGANINSKIENFYIKKKDIYYVYDGEYNFNLTIKKLIQNNFFIVPVIDNKNNLIDFISFKHKNKKNNFFHKFQIIIMAGGEGSRMKPFTKILPKPLIPINEKSVLEHIVENFLNQSINKFYVSINFKSEIIKAFIQELNKKLKIDIKVIKENMPLGTCGSLKLLENEIKGDFFVSNCDTLLDINFNDAMKFHKKNRNYLTIIGCKKKFQIPFGVLKTEKNNNLMTMNEKPVKRFFANTGLYIFNSKILKKIKKNKKTDINEIIELLKKDKQKIGVYKIDEGKWNDVGQWSEYKKTLSIINENN